jgi:hypothetical protein
MNIFNKSKVRSKPVQHLPRIALKLMEQLVRNFVGNVGEVVLKNYKGVVNFRESLIHVKKSFESCVSSTRRTGLAHIGTDRIGSMMPNFYCSVYLLLYSSNFFKKIKSCENQ